jgi:hypothetical protein
LTTYTGTKYWRMKVLSCSALSTPTCRGISFSLASTAATDNGLADTPLVRMWVALPCQILTCLSHGRHINRSPLSFPYGPIRNACVNSACYQVLPPSPIQVLLLGPRSHETTQTVSLGVHKYRVCAELSHLPRILIRESCLHALLGSCQSRPKALLMPPTNCSLVSELPSPNLKNGHNLRSPTDYIVKNGCHWTQWPCCSARAFHCPSLE